MADVKVHDVERDYAGFNQNIPRLTCYTCDATLLYKTWMRADEWAKAVADFRVAHPSEKS